MKEIFVVLTALFVAVGAIRYASHHQAALGLSHAAEQVE